MGAILIPHSTQYRKVMANCISDKLLIILFYSLSRKIPILLTEKKNICKQTSTKHRNIENRYM